MVITELGRLSVLDALRASYQTRVARCASWVDGAELRRWTERPADGARDRCYAYMMRSNQSYAV